MNTQILWYASRATGAVSLVLFTAVMVLGILTAGRKGSTFLPRAAVLRLHRTLSITSMAFLAIHIVTAIADGYVDLNYWDVLIPFGAAWDPLWVGLGTVAVDLMLAIGITSALRRHLPAVAWKAVHLSSYAMWPIALLHGFGISGGDGTRVWMIAIDIVCIVSVLVTLTLRLLPDRHPDTVARRAAETTHPREEIGSHR
ncbi:putative ferric reductase [Nakamurella sp. UYEF19]|uniref:ferric reductase-like transmembrane domain-containing protein n=1 Tax=Nakamurella sp. UYEF19 TaxID=1756392 RepID=UPI003395EE28